MYRLKNRKAHAHNTYVRPDRVEIMRLAEQLCWEIDGVSLSRWITDLVEGVLNGTVEIIRKQPKKSKKGAQPRGRR